MLDDLYLDMRGMNTEIRVIQKGLGDYHRADLDRLRPGLGAGEGASGPRLEPRGPRGAGRGRRGRVSDPQGRGVLDGEPQKTGAGCVLSSEQNCTSW